MLGLMDSARETSMAFLAQACLVRSELDDDEVLNPAVHSNVLDFLSGLC